MATLSRFFPWLRPLPPLGGPQEPWGRLRSPLLRPQGPPIAPGLSSLRRQTDHLPPEMHDVVRQRAPQRHAPHLGQAADPERLQASLGLQLRVDRLDRRGTPLVDLLGLGRPHPLSPRGDRVAVGLLRLDAGRPPPSGAWGPACTASRPARPRRPGPGRRASRNRRRPDAPSRPHRSAPRPAPASARPARRRCPRWSPRPRRSRGCRCPRPAARCTPGGCRRRAIA